MKRTLITSALPYSNGYTHLGHAAGSFLPADLYARFMRLAGEHVLYICGSDEYGVAISIAAEKEGVTPRELTDKYHAANEEALKRLGMSFDLYYRTASPVHDKTTQEFFLDLLEKGYLVEKEEAQFYDEEAQMFLPDRYVEGTCPNCGYDRARGDQCDNCGAYYNQLDLKHPRSLVSGKPPIVKNTTHWYFRLGEFQSWLEHYISRNTRSQGGLWKENVVQQAQSWLKQGLGDRAITRDLAWGVPVPLERAKGKVIYVWFDAVLGYISITKRWAELQGDPEAWKDWWLAPTDGSTTDYVAFLGKDNIVFHAIMFPAMLHGRGNYILPTNVAANEFLNLEGQKFSKSRGWAIDMRDYFADFPEPQHVDALRYVLTMNMPETKDSDFTWKDFQARVNNELAAILGNFINRSVQFIHKNFAGTVPLLPERYKKMPEAWKLLVEDVQMQPLASLDSSLEALHTKYLHYFSLDDIRLIASVVLSLRAVESNYRSFRFRDAAVETMNIARAANKYFNDCSPWKTIKENPEECAKTLYVCSQVIRTLGYAVSPIMPNTALALLDLLGLHDEREKPPHKQFIGEWKTLALPLVATGTSLAPPALLFTKIEDSTIAAQIAKLGRIPNNSLPNAHADNAQITHQEMLAIDDFKKIHLRTGKVLEASRIPKSDKLLKLIVDVGTEQRQILAGIGKFYTPEEMVGKTVVVVVNLKPAKLMGLESQGMLLAANTDDGLLALVVPDKGDITPGAEVR
jgi:methionyl-tRNA synthetase